MKIIFYFSLLLISEIFFGCKPRYSYPPDVDSSLEIANSNRDELIAVLEHYRLNSADSLKLKAAYYLIANMKGHYSKEMIRTIPKEVKGSFLYMDSLTKKYFFSPIDKNLFSFVEFLHTELDTDDFIHSKPYIDSLISKSYFNHYSNIELFKKQFNKFEYLSNNTSNFLLNSNINIPFNSGIYSDLMLIKSEFLINHIDNSFNVWKHSPAASCLSFDEFKQIILPYRSWNEPIDMNPHFINKIFFPIINAKNNKDLEDVIRRLNFYIYCLDVFEDDGKLLGPLGFYDILQYYKYDCDRHSEWVVQVLNSCGIPAQLDFTSGFFNRDKPHYGVSVRDSKGKYHHFTPKWQALGDTNHAKMFSKVFRRTFEPQPCPYTLKAPNESVPNIFGDQFIKDVTDEYHKTFNITVHYEKIDMPYNVGYLAIFMPSGWKPIGWGLIDPKNKTISFEKVPVNATYIAGIFENGSFHPLTDPFYFGYNGKLSYIKSSTNKKGKVLINFKYPHKENHIAFMKQLIGTKIQASNNHNFSDSVTLHTLNYSDIQDFTIKSFKFTSLKKYRYLRCIPEKGCALNIATFEVFTKAVKGQKLTKGSLPSVLDRSSKFLIDTSCLTRVHTIPLQNEQKVENALDENMETFVNTFSIELDLLNPSLISEIRFAPRNSNNGVVIGNRYELFYYDKKWISCGSQIAKYNFLEFDNVPSDTIYWLRNLDTGKEELAFLYQNHKQIFINNDLIK